MIALRSRHERVCKCIALTEIESAIGGEPSAAGTRDSALVRRPAELFEVLHREKFRRYIDEDDIRHFLAALTREAFWIDVDVEVIACRDPKDDKFLSLAVSGSATHIVIGDADLLVLHPFRGIEIVSPSAFAVLP